MPKYTSTVRVPGRDAATLQALCLATLKELGWPVDLVTDTALVGRTLRRWNRADNRIILDVRDEEFTITSELIHGELMDLAGRAEEDVDQYCEAFENVHQDTSVDISELRDTLLQHQETTIKDVARQEEEIREVENVMHLSHGSRWLTYGIIAVNVLVFLLMALAGAGIFEPEPTVHISWGSNFSVLTSTGDYWRLFTNTFLHFGILHLVLNLYALVMVGMYLEPMLGKVRFVAAYLSTGLLASITSLWWHTDGVNSAGASGAIFGLYGLFLALLSAKLIPDLVRRSLLASTTMFIGYNLFFGSLEGGVDNAAHISGLFSGFLIGMFYLPALRHERERNHLAHWQGLPVLAAAVVICFYYLQQHPGSMEERKAVEKELYHLSFPDQELFNQKVNEFNKWNSYGLSLVSGVIPGDKDQMRMMLMPSRRYWQQADRTLAVSARATTCCVLGLRAEVDLVRQQGVVASWCR
ncbi:MAG: rhomboid family intramembrane serine protease [Candidatus Kapabacteria bacterium]|nr:rhomboid family intramembrane serine protease [Candidatus Kapabacteria bacterium]